MSYLSVLFSQPSGMSPAAREIRNPKSEIRNDAWDAEAYGTVGSVPSEEALPSGVASMEHWLDLNA